MDFFSYEPPPPEVPAYQLVPRAPLHDLMFKKLKELGVHVHWSVYHSGKSTSARIVAKKLWDNGIGIKFVKARFILVFFADTIESANDLCCTNMQECLDPRRQEFC